MVGCRLIGRAVVVVGLGVLVSACHSTPPAPDSSLGVDALADLTIDGRVPPDASADGSARSQQCLEQDSKLQAALDGARKSPNAMLAVRNVACGTTVYVSGDPATATRSSLWRIGSVTKTYVSAAVLVAVHNGELSLDDAVSKWVPGIAQTDGVTIKMLLNHSSGLFNYTEDPTFGSDPARVWKPSELVALATSHDRYFAPGAGWHYSNTNYILLGMVLEAVKTAKASAVIRASALLPAGLTHTFLDGEETLQGQLASGFDKNKNDVTHAFDMSGPWTAGAMAANGADLCDWVATLYGDTKVLDEAGKKLLTEGAIVVSSTEKYGLGVELLDASITGGAGPAMGHGGSIAGFFTQAYWFPDQKTAICSVVNQDGTSPNDITLAALLALFHGL